MIRYYVHPQSGVPGYGGYPGDSKAARLRAQGYLEVDTPPPSEQHVFLDGRWQESPALVAARDRLAAMRARAVEMPTIAEQVDALMEWVAAQPGPRPRKLQEALARIAAAKAQHPIPGD